MKEQQLHIVSFDVPFPPNYGGAVDVFYKIRALYNLGVKIHLHCFEYGRGKQKELNNYCASVTYYQRDKSKAKLLSKLPFIVATRKNEQLLKNLNKNDYPILIEGLHNCWFLDELKPSKRFVAVRTHNVEHDYYKGLAKVEKSLFKKQFFLSEAKKLKAFESVLKKADLLLSISPNDTDYFHSKYKNAKYLPAFHSGEEITARVGRGTFALYHGNLGVGENNEASLYLIDVFSKLNYPLVLAGSDPSKELIKKVSQSKNVNLSSNISFTEMENLIAAAHMNILPTFQPTGIKLKFNRLWEATYLYKDVEKNAVFGALVNSDFGGGGTDHKGHQMIISYSFSEKLSFDFIWFDNKKRMETDYQSAFLDFKYKL